MSAVAAVGSRTVISGNALIGLPGEGQIMSRHAGYEVRPSLPRGRICKVMGFDAMLAAQARAVCTVLAKIPDGSLGNATKQYRTKVRGK